MLVIALKHDIKYFRLLIRNKFMRKIVVILTIVAMVCSCGDIFEYHPFDGRIDGEKNINKKHIASIEEACKDKPVIKFVMLSDTHRHYDETQAFVNEINKRTDIDFVIHGGAITDLGATKEYVWMRDIMSKLKVPYVALIGNHDCLANGEDVFKTVYGDTNFSFMAGSIKFVCLNTNAQMYDYSENVPDFGFMEDEFKKTPVEDEKTIFVMHAAPFSGQFNNNVSRVFHRFIKEFPQLQFCLNGHDHETTTADLFEDGVIYYGCPDISQKTYLEFTVSKEGYKYEAVVY